MRFNFELWRMLLVVHCLVWRFLFELNEQVWFELRLRVVKQLLVLSVSRDRKGWLLYEVYLCGLTLTNRHYISCHKVSDTRTEASPTFEISGWGIAWRRGF